MIPNKFELMGDEWQVVILEDPKNSEVFGTCIHSSNTIQLHRLVSGDKVTDCRLEATLYHEVIHAILSSMCREDLNSSEEFVSILSGLFHQFVKSKK